MPVQINKEDYAKPWRPGVYPKSTTVIYNNQLWILNDTITGLFTSSDFLAEAANGDWVGRYTTEGDISGKENVSNKATDFTTINHILYPTVEAVKDYVDANIGGEIDYAVLKYNVGNCSSMGYSFSTLAISNLRTAPSLSTGATFIALATTLTSYFNSMMKYGVRSGGTAGAMIGLNPQTEYVVSRQLGFYHSISFGVADPSPVATARMAIGVSSNGSTTADVNPSTLLSCILLGNDTGDTNLQIMHNDFSGTCTKIDLGVNFPANTQSTDWYKFELFCLPGASEVTYKVTRKNTGDIATGVLTTNIPPINQGLGFHFKRGSGTTASEVRLAFGQFTRSILG
jgi:hypothetical protein